MDDQPKRKRKPFAVHNWHLIAFFIVVIIVAALMSRQPQTGVPSPLQAPQQPSFASPKPNEKRIAALGAYELWSWGGGSPGNDIILELRAGSQVVKTAQWMQVFTPDQIVIGQPTRSGDYDVYDIKVDIQMFFDRHCTAKIPVVINIQPELSCP